MANVGYNVEWSQELKLEQSLREYVKAAMLLEILKASERAGRGASSANFDTVFDMSVGYNLEGHPVAARALVDPVDEERGGR